MKRKLASVFTVPDGGALRTFEKDGPDWVTAIACCECGLAHTIRVGFHHEQLAMRAWRNRRLTAQIRKAAKGNP